MTQRPGKKIREVSPARIADFDDQLWPINCVILILAGFVSGLVIATSDFHDPRILYNAWFRLATVAAAVGILFWAVFWLQGKMVRRVQLCVMVSLLVHLWLGLYLHQQYLALVARHQAEMAERLLEEYEPETIPDYYWEHVEQPETKQNFEEPVETHFQAEEVPERIDRQTTEHETRSQQKAETEPETSKPLPEPASPRRAELTAPRRAREAAGAQISRQEWKNRPEPGRPIPLPEIAAGGQQSPAAPEARVTELNRAETRAAMPQREVFESEPSAEQRRDPMRLARRASEPKPTVSPPSTPRPTRKLARPADVARTEATAPAPRQTARQPRRTEPALAATLARRQASAPANQAPLPEAQAETRLPARTQQPQLPSALARRQKASQQSPPAQAAMPSEPGTLVRSSSGINLPSSALPVET